MILTIAGKARKPTTYKGIAKLLVASRKGGILDLDGGEFDFTLLADALEPTRLIATPTGDGKFRLEVK